MVIRDCVRVLTEADDAPLALEIAKAHASMLTDIIKQNGTVDLLFFGLNPTTSHGRQTALF
jgi:hypothetical protein